MTINVKYPAEVLPYETTVEIGFVAWYPTLGSLIATSSEFILELIKDSKAEADPQALEGLSSSSITAVTKARIPQMNTKRAEVL